MSHEVISLKKQKKYNNWMKRKSEIKEQIED